MKPFFTRNKAITLVSVAFLLIAWKVLSLCFSNSLILPSPEETFLALVRVTGNENFWQSIASTIGRGLLGFAISFILGLGFGLWAGVSSQVHAALKPLLVSIRSTPVISFILLALIWFNVNQVPVFIAFLTMFPIIVTNIIEGIRSQDKELVEMAKVYRIKHSRIIREIHIPSILPFITSGISSAMGFGWRAVIIGEVLSQPRYGVGTLMQDAQRYLMVSELIAWTVIAIIISYMFEWFIRALEKYLVKWE